jgi:hypothetical protein
MQIYLYIGLAIAVYVISVIKTYGLGYDRGFRDAKEWEDSYPDYEEMENKLEDDVTMDEVLGNSQIVVKTYVEDTSGKTMKIHRKDP